MIVEIIKWHDYFFPKSIVRRTRWFKITFNKDPIGRVRSRSDNLQKDQRHTSILHRHLYCRHLYCTDIYTAQTSILHRLLYCTDFYTAQTSILHRHLYCTDIYTAQTSILHRLPPEVHHTARYRGPLTRAALFQPHSPPPPGLRSLAVKLWLC